MAKKSPPKQSDNPNFEQALGELEQLVEKLEQGDLSLEESLKDFERGIELTRSCQKSLQEAEQKVQILMKRDGQEELAPFDGTEEDS